MAAYGFKCLRLHLSNHPSLHVTTLGERHPDARNSNGSFKVLLGHPNTLRA